MSVYQLLKTFEIITRLQYNNYDVYRRKVLRKTWAILYFYCNDRTSTRNWKHSHSTLFSRNIAHKLFLDSTSISTIRRSWLKRFLSRFGKVKIKLPRQFSITVLLVVLQTDFCCRVVSSNFLKMVLYHLSALHRLLNIFIWENLWKDYYILKNITWTFSSWNK